VGEVVCLQLGNDNWLRIILYWKKLKINQKL
jgi:hypothetical protein